MKSTQRVAKLEARQVARDKFCKACSNASGASPPYLEVEGDPDEPHNLAYVESQRLRGCAVCGREPRIRAIVIVRPEEAVSTNGRK